MLWSDYILFAYCDPVSRGTFLTHHIATPMKFTVTSVNTCHFNCVIASSTAQRLTVVNMSTSPVTNPSMRARGGPKGISVTEVRRSFKIN